MRDDTVLELNAPRMTGLAEQLDESVEKLREWGIRIIDASRLKREAAILQAVGAAGAFPNDRSELTAIAHAARDAQEFAEIAQVIPDEALRPLANSIQEAVKGAPGSSANKAVQYQSELWVGAMLAYSGSSTAVVTRASGRRPDFVLTHGTMYYPHEVKRPAGELNAASIIQEAAGQIRGSKYHGGVIVVDLSDCLGDELAVQFGRGVPETDRVNSRILDLTADLNREILDDSTSRIKKGREHVFCLHSFARSIYWDEECLDHIYLLRLVISIVYYRGSQNSLRGHRARMLANTLDAGIKAAGHREVGTVPAERILRERTHGA